MEVDDTYGNALMNFDSSEDEGVVDEAQEDTRNVNDESSKPIKAKRVIKNPQPKLDSIRLMGSRGIGILESTFKDVKFKGKGHEKEDLDLLMKKMQHWAHRLYPKLPFEDTLKQIEKLGSKKPVQVTMKRLRLDMFESQEIIQNPQDTAAESQTVEVDVFDELLGPRNLQDDSAPPIPSLLDSPLQTSKPKPTLTAEQQEKIERNRRIAEEKRKARFLERLERERIVKKIPEEKEPSAISGSWDDDDEALNSIIIAENQETSKTDKLEKNCQQQVSADIIDFTDSSKESSDKMVTDKNVEMSECDEICTEDEILKMTEEDF